MSVTQSKSENKAEKKLSKEQERLKKVKDAQKVKDRIISVFIGFFALAWLFPIVWTFYSSLRPYKEIRA